MGDIDNAHQHSLSLSLSLSLSQTHMQTHTVEALHELENQVGDIDNANDLDHPTVNVGNTLATH